MKNTKEKIAIFGGPSGIDTLFVLFFLALEYGRAVEAVSVDGFLMGTTMLMVLVLPYFLPSRWARPQFANWLVARGLVTMAAVILGVGFRQSLGVILPESVRFMPMTFLIMASMISCYIQFYSLLKLRPAK